MSYDHFLGYFCAVSSPIAPLAVATADDGRRTPGVAATAEIALSGLDRDVTDKKLNLFQFSYWPISSKWVSKRCYWSSGSQDSWRLTLLRGYRVTVSQIPTDGEVYQEPPPSPSAACEPPTPVCHGGTGKRAPRRVLSSANHYCRLPPTATGSLQPYRIAIKRSPKQRSAPTVIAAEDET